MNNNLLMGGIGFELGQPINQEDDILLNQNPLQDLIDKIVYACNEFMSGSQLVTLNDTLFEVLNKFDIIVDDVINRNENYEKENEEIFQKYLKASTLEGKSQRTLNYYEESYRNLMDFCCKHISEVTTQDIRNYLSFKQKQHNCSNATLDNNRRNLSTVFRWFHEEGYIAKNPVIKIGKIKDRKKVKKPFTPREIELLRNEFNRYPNTRLRDLAMFELLLSSGIRVGELCGLNQSDVDLDNCSMIVLGKGNKQREAYFNVKTQTALEEYLNSRTDDNPALFVSFKKPYRRLGINGVERRMRVAGRNVGVKTHPHKFRRTMATTLLNKGVPIEQVQILLGHNKLDTTTIYAQVDDEQLRYNHKRLFG